MQPHSKFHFYTIAIFHVSNKFHIVKFNCNGTLLNYLSNEPNIIQVTQIRIKAPVQMLG